MMDMIADPRVRGLVAIQPLQGPSTFCQCLPSLAYWQAEATENFYLLCQVLRLTKLIQPTRSD